ncbi:hypothetical protein C2845_PM04G22770 [Panicum miliaceum]|uniref:BED-type domain-containing protein n=1 Tax=Panicum miliaceum TaxID=4540 RepID=A0A3L6QVC8_PANMI|nr:hypothetical protein C2845_PM04G22770 [Panicum miliaceum]
MGGVGDDEEDLQAGREELFGRNANALIDLVDAGDGEGDAGVAGSATGAGASVDRDTESTGAKRNRPCTSDVWEDYEKIFSIENGKRVRFQAKCLHCGKFYAAPSNFGTRTLKRHRAACSVRNKKSRSSQSLLQFSLDGSLGNWEYSPEVARTQLYRLIARLDLPLGFGDCDAFEEYIKLAHNPRFATVSRQTTSRDLVKYYTDRRNKVTKTLVAALCVALTFDIWYDNAKEDYLSVVVHFVSADWDLEKRIIGLRLINVSHNGDNIAECVLAVLQEFGLTDKVVSLTLDNASANTSAMNILSPQISGYVGTLFLHYRCACHIINLIVKSGLKRISHYLDAFRTTISFLNSSNQRIASYKYYCIIVNERPRKFQLDMDVRWTSTYLMLKYLVPHKQSFSVFIQTHYSKGEEGSPMLLTNVHWYVVEHILTFLELFYDLTVALSVVYDPTSPLILHHIIEIAGHLNNYENDCLLRSVVVHEK